MNEVFECNGCGRLHSGYRTRIQCKAQTSKFRTHTAWAIGLMNHDNWKASEGDLRDRPATEYAHSEEVVDGFTTAAGGELGEGF